MRPGGKSNGESPFFEKPILSFEKPGRGNVAPIPYPDWSGERRLGERARGRLGERGALSSSSTVLERVLDGGCRTSPKVQNYHKLSIN